MKNNFDRTKTETSKLGTRSLALLMFFVMLFTAIGSGSVLSALAVTRGDEGADDSIAESVDVTDDFASSADLYDTEETMLGRKADLDLAATGLDDGDGIHLGIGTTATTWHGMGDSAYEFTLNAATTIYYTFSCKGSNFGKGSSTNAPTAGSQETYTWYTDKTSSTQFSIALPAGTYKFKLKGIQSNNANCLEYQFWKVSGGSGGGGDDPVTPGEAVSADLAAILKGTKIQFYYGLEVNNDTVRLNDDNSTDMTTESLTTYTKCKGGVATVPASNYSATGTYYISNSSTWKGAKIDSVKAGELYCIYEWTKFHGGNTCNTAFNWSKNSDTVKYNATTTTLAATVTGSTSHGSTDTVKYYIEIGSDIYELSTSSLPSLDPGTYNVYAAATDGKIYIASTTKGTLTVLPKLASKLDIEADPDTLTAEGQSSTITVTASDLVSGQDNLTYTLYKKGASSDTQVEQKMVTDGADTTTFTVTPNARSTDYYATVAPTAGTTSYDAVQSGTVTISNTDEQYVPTYTVNFSSSNTTYGTVTAKSTYKGTTTTLTSGDSVKEGASVTFTATEKTGGTFVGWDNFDSSATTVTRVIRAATTVQGVFGQKGYKLLIKNGTTVDMKELPNGTYISPSAYAKSTVFQIARNANSTRSLSSETTQGVAPDGTKYKVTSWASGTAQDGNSFTTYDNQSGSLYIVYDPATDQVWLTSEPDDLYGVTVIAKDGTIRYGHSTADKYTSAFGDTTLTITDGEGTNIASHDAFGGLAKAVDLTAAQVRKGITLKVTTQVDQAHVASGYYVKGFVVSGYEESFSVLMQDFNGNEEVTPTNVSNWINTGYNEFELTLDTYPAKNIEITPVYAIKEETAGTNIRFYVDGFAGEVYKAWDGVIAVDAYNTSGDPVLGEYPGQPMINYNGRYMVDLPRTGVTGITLNNYVWDRVHSNLFYGTDGVDNPTKDNGYLQKIQAANKQTYDFNDFVYLKQVMDANKKDEDIIFSFRHKYDENHDTVETSNLGQSTYYKDTPSSTATTDFDYRKDFNTINPNDSIYQWENLTDFYDNRVDIFGDKIDIKNTEGESENPKAAYDNPIRIVSNGYDFSKAGKYATAWAVYAPVDASGNAAYKGAYDHYKLVDVFGGQGIVSGGVGTWESSAYLVNPDHKTSLRDKYDKAYAESSQPHSGSSFVYDMAKIPTVISYEYAVYRNKSNLNLENAGSAATDGNPGLRSDGRWFTTTSDQFLTAHTVVEYAEKDDDSLYHRDYFQSGGIDYTSGSEYDKTFNTGLSTGIKAYFENNDSDDGEDSKTGVAYQNTPGDTEAYAVSDGEHTFNLKTVGDTNGDYVFKGWYLYSNGKYSFITRDTSYESEATANDVYVARYYKIPSGNIQITHNLHTDSTGFADCLAKVEVVDATNTDTHVGWVQQEFTSEAIKAGSQYIKSNSNNALKITLKTEPDSVSKLEDFYESIVGSIEEMTNSGIADVNGATVSLDKGNNQATVIIPITRFFNNEEQTIKSLPFFSKVSNIPHGDLTVSHVIDDRSTGTGTAKVRVQVLDGNDVEKYDSGMLTEEDIQLDSTYIRKGSGYKIHITLQTEMGNFSKFNRFWVDYKGEPSRAFDLGNHPGPNSESCNQTLSTDKKTSELTYHFSVESLFDNNNVLKFSELPFYSLIDKPDFKYELTYTYPAYNSSYGNQSYTVKGKFTDDELALMNYDNEELSFNTDTDNEKKRTFINSHAPYEDNFTKLIRYDNYAIPERNWVGATATFKLAVTLDVKQEKVVASFKLPYDYIDATSFTPKENINTKKVSYKTEYEAVPGLQEIYSRDWYATNGQRTATEDNIKNATFVKAPLILSNPDTGKDEKFFQYWSVKTVEKYNQNSVEYTRCYDPEFNLAIFQDVIIEPIYSNVFPAGMPNPPSKWDDYGRFDPDVLRNQDATGITITFLENSRNQYNNNAYGDGSNASTIPDSRKGAGDRIYSDFLLSYNGIAGNVELRKEYAGQKKAGLVIEAVAEMDKDETGKYITDASHYRDNVSGKVPDVPTATIEAYLMGGSRPDGIAKTEFDVKELDNKNRIQYYYSLTNRPHKALNADDPFMADGVYGNNNKKYFRAYAYIMNNDGTDIRISSHPVYFTIYDMATIENGKFSN